MTAVTMYTTSWCGYCFRLKKVLKAEGISFDEVDIELDPAAAEFVGSVNGGNRTVPTVKFSDGSTLTNPSVTEVKAKLAEVADLPQSSAAQDSMITRAIEIDPGSSSFESEALLQSPASSAARTSSRVTHFASAISPSLNENSCSGSARAWKPTISDRGNGHGWLPR